MPPGLLLAPVGAGKTEFALEQIVATAQAQPFAPIWVLLPTERQKDAFRQRLIERPSGQGTAAQRGVYFNIEFFNFYELYIRLLDMAGKPPRHLDYRADTARFRLLRTVLRGLKRDGQLRVFAQIADKPGFVSVIADFIYELKGNVIPPEVFEAAAATRTEKDRELARIYSAYQSLLIEHNIVDREGQGWVALEAAHKNYDLGADVALLVVDGFDQFTVLQARLVALLASRAQNALLTLTVVPGREGTVGRRFWQAQDRLLTTFLDEMGEELTMMQSARLGVERRPSPLLYLANQIFHPEAMEVQPSAGHLRLIEAPNPTQEVGALLREVKRLLLRTASEGEVRPDDVLIALRDWGRYAAQFAALARSYGVPVALHSGEPLIENPAIIALLD
ncbi:MAG: hypothetical protein H7175_01485, partial [Burkholderiales bacterium]|nr:hypothetical protein [Anaerolineae bacterium]